MATIRTALQMYDGMTPALKSVTNAMNIVISSFEQMQRTSSQAVDVHSLQAARAELNQVEAAFNDVENSIRQSEQQQENLNHSIQRGTGFAAGLKQKILGIASVYGVFKWLRSGFDRLMGIDTARAKLDALGHSAKAVEVIMDNAITAVRGTAFRMEESANTAASAVAAGIRPGQQLERYLSLVADAAAIAGINMGEMGAIFNKITTSGRIQAEELNQLSDRGIPIFQMLADVMGVTAQEIRQLASDGEISSQIFLNAIEEGFGGAAQIMGTSSFQATLANIGASISRIAANFLDGAGEGQGFFSQVKPLMVDLLETLQGFEDKVIVIGEIFGRVFMGIYNTISKVANLIIDNWSIIQPIMWGAIGALLVYNATVGIAYLTTLKNVAAKVADTIVSWASIPAIFAMTVAQEGLNAALAACPLTWIIMMVIALIAVFYVVIAVINKLAGTSLSATGIIAGAFMVALTFIANLFRAFGNLVLTLIAVVWNNFATFAEFLANVFVDPLGSIVRLFAGMADNVLQILGGIAKAIDTVFGSNLASAVSGWRSSLGGKVIDLVGEAKVKIPRMDPSAHYLDRLEYGKAWNTGYNFGQQLQDRFSSALSGAGDSDIANLLDGIYDAAGDTAGNTKKAADSLKISEEDLKHLRDLAEREIIDRTVLRDVKVELTNTFGDIRETADIDGIMTKIETRLEEALASEAEGSFA